MRSAMNTAGVRYGRLHDARHTAATVLLLLCVPERTVMGVMGWSTTGIAARYQHVTDSIRRKVAGLVDGLICAPEEGDETIPWFSASERVRLTNSARRLPWWWRRRRDLNPREGLCPQPA